MSSSQTQTFSTSDPESTRRLGQSLGSVLSACDVVCLIGDLGAGKTTFTQGLAQGLDLPPEEPVNSPTFTLVAEHLGGRLPLYHFDVYRLPDETGLYELAFDEYLDAGGVVVIEWADKIIPALPPDRLEIAFSIAGDAERRLTVSAHGHSAAGALQRLALEYAA